MLKSLFVLWNDAKRAYQASDLARYWASTHEALLVMGAFGQNIAREVLFGSVTRCVIEQCAMPIFLYH